MSWISRCRILIELLLLGIVSGSSGEPAFLASGEAVPTNRMLFGVNRPWPMSGQKLDDPELLRALRALHVGALRFPGGTVGSFWDLAAGRFVPEADINGFGFARWAAQYTRAAREISRLPANQFGIQAFDKLARQICAGVCWVVNLATLSGEHEAEAISHMKTCGVELSYLELGNEYDMGLFRRVMPKVSDYISRSHSVVERARHLFPKARIAVCASRVDLGAEEHVVEKQKPSDERTRRWNEDLLKYRDTFDAWVVHDYGLGLNLLRKLSEADRLSAVLAYPQASLGAIASTIRTRYSGVPVWITEYNAAFHGLNREEPSRRDSAAAFLENMKNSGLHALMVAGYILSAVEDADIYKVLCYHSLSGMDGFGITKFNGNEPGTRCLVNASAQVFAHVASVATNSSQMATARIDNNPSLGLNLLGRNDLKALQAAVFLSNSRVSYVVLNRSARAASVALSVPDGFGKAVRTVYVAGGPPRPLPWFGLPEAEAELPWPGPMKPETTSLDITTDRVECEVPGTALAIVELCRVERGDPVR
ncbi:MAG: hypothetical protein ACP5R5_07120 [Armatimonadota bacterium]